MTTIGTLAVTDRLLETQTNSPLTLESVMADLIGLLVLVAILFTPIVLIMGPLVLLLIFGWALPRLKRTNTAWARLAQEEGLQLVRGTLFRAPVLQGVYQGLPIQVTVLHSKARRNTTQWTRVSAVPSVVLPKGLRLRRRDLISDLDKLLGVRDIETGRLDFDKRMMTVGRSKIAVRRFLSDDMCDAMDAHIDASNMLDEDLGFAVIREGVINDLTQLRVLLESACAGARAVEGASAPSRLAWG